MGIKGCHEASLNCVISYSWTLNEWKLTNPLLTIIKHFELTQNSQID